MSIWKCMQFRHFRLEHSNYLDVKMAKKKTWQMAKNNISISLGNFMEIAIGYKCFPISL